ncbi:MAG: RNA-binding protein [Thaumarchaeota archaeon]|nr:MAG: RNA-binding protein [Nitrososphaerota archaeon]TLX94917.1 MAG: RNA-binding protein [Nitrososphaerota archaeon]
MKSHALSKSSCNETLDKITSQWQIEIPKIKTLVLHELDESASLIKGDSFTALKIGDIYLPFLSETSLLEKFPKVVVDTGAIKFVCNGANVMRPGIRKHTEFKKDDIICVVEEAHNKYLAVGKSLVSSNEMQNITKGEVVKNLHYISDKYWETAKLIK